MSQGENKVLIVSLDGATLDVLRPMMAQGYMPCLAALASRGVVSTLTSVIPPVTAPAWTSFMTGKDPGKHGIFDFTRFEEQNYSWRINNSQHIRSKTLWQILSEQGKRVIVLNLPYTYPPYEVNGVMVSGWDAPFLGADFSYPTSLSKEILSAMPDYGENLDLPLSSNMPNKSDALFDRFVDKLMRGASQGTELALQLMGSHSWDVCMVHFQQTDWMQHNLWVSIEDACSDPANKSYRVERTRSCYQHFDRMIGRLFEAVDPASTVKIVLSDHGFGRNRGNICPNYYLQQWAYLTHVARSESVATRLHRRSKKILKKLGTLLSRGTDKTPKLRSFESFDEMIERTAPHQRIPLDWTKTKAALVVGSETGFVYVNVRGRGVHGIVEPGVEYERVLADLLARFAELRHPVSKERLFSRVARGSDIYPQPAEGVRIPDIVLVPTDGYKFSYEVSSAPPILSTHGNHRTEGVLFIEGLGLRIGIPDFRPRLIDLAPTVLHMLGLPVPDDMDGRVLAEIFSDHQDVRFVEAAAGLVRQSAIEYNIRETELIEQRLKGLGYIE